MGLRFLTAGESHGKALVGILEGLPAGLEISNAYIQLQMRRRKMGYGRGARQKIEDDAVEILSGVRHGKTLGSPVALLLWNKDWKNWEQIMQPDPFKGEVEKQVHVPRPGHADLVGALKYDHKSDMRNVLERASARETAARVALGTVCRKFLQDLEISIGSRVTRIGSVEDTGAVTVPIASLNELADKSPLRSTNPAVEEAMMEEITKAKKAGDTVGGIFEVYAEGSPIGLGSYAQWDRRLEGPLTAAFMSLNAIKGVEIGEGFRLATIPGSKAHDAYVPDAGKKSVTYKSNHAGGITGGMSTGQKIVVRAAMKPIATLMTALDSVDLRTNTAESAHVERSDYCAVPAAAVIGEALMALVLTEAVLEKFGGDSMGEVLQRVRDWNEKTRPKKIEL